MSTTTLQRPDRDEVRECVLRAIDELNPQLAPEQQIERSCEARLFGREAPLDSLGLVNLIVAVEEQLADELGVEVTLASDKAMSRSSSPFKSVATLIDFINELLREQAGE